MALIVRFKRRNLSRSVYLSAVLLFFCSISAYPQPLPGQPPHPVRPANPRFPS